MTVQCVSQRLGQQDSKSLASRDHFWSLFGRDVEIIGIRMPGFGVPVEIRQRESWW